MTPLLVIVALVAGLLGVVAGPASALDFTNACQNSVTANSSESRVTMTAVSPGSVAPGASVSLASIAQTLTVPGSIFVAGYNLGLLQVGPNTIPASVRTTIEGTNTVEGTQNTNFASGSITPTITDPDGSPGTGDETATDGSLSVTYANLTWTAGSSGTIDFREDTVTPLSTATNAEVGGVVIRLVIGGFLNVRFACSPGTVTGPDPGTVSFVDPAASFASTEISSGGNQTPTADAGTDQTVASGASVSLDGTQSTDPDGDALTYSWSQTAGPSVTLSGSGTATPSFTAPTGPATLTFDLQVCDPAPACDTDDVVITVQAPIPVFLGFTKPLPKETLSSRSAVAVKFRLGDAAGVPLTDQAASLVQTQVTLSANADGSQPLSLATCVYSNRNHRYQCSLKAPKNAAKQTPYYITAYELIGSSYVKAPVAPNSAVSNPLIVFFR